MRYEMKQRFWSLGDDFTIRDDSGNECYIVDGRALSLGDQLSLADVHGNQLALIRERLLSWGPTYEILLEGGQTVVLRKEWFTFFSCRFEIDGPDNADFEASGDFFDHEYEIRGSHGLAAVISKRWMSWSDTYGIDIDDREDPVLLLASAVVIDLICHGEKN